MLKDEIIPVFTTFFKEHFLIDVVVEEMPAISPIFKVSTYNGTVKKHLIIIYVDDRRGHLPLLNIYHYDGAEHYLVDMLKQARRDPDHYTKVRSMFERVHAQLGIFNMIKFEKEDDIFDLFKSSRVNSINDFNQLTGHPIAAFQSCLAETVIEPYFVFTIYEHELHVDLRLNYSVGFYSHMVSSHPQLLADKPSLYEDFEKELYHSSRASIINKIRQKLNITLNPKSVEDEEIVRYVQVLEMEKI